MLLRESLAMRGAGHQPGADQLSHRISEAAAGYSDPWHRAGGAHLLFGYDLRHRLGSFTDPLGRTVGFAYDLADRVTTQALLDGRQIGYTYL